MFGNRMRLIILGLKGSMIAKYNLNIMKLRKVIIGE